MEKESEIIKKMSNKKWKFSNKKYVFELQKFLDIADNIKDEELRIIVVGQMLKCDRRLTKVAEEMFKKIREET